MIFPSDPSQSPKQFYLLYSLQITGYFLDNHLEHGTRVARVALKRVLATLSLSNGARHVARNNI